MYLLTGCYSFTGSALPQYLRTVRIPLVENRTVNTSVDNNLHRSLTDEFVSASGLRMVNSNAHSELRVTLLNFANTMDAYARRGSDDYDVTQFRVSIRLEAVFFNNVKSEEIYSGKINAWGVYDRDGGTEAEAVDKAVEMAVREIINETVSDW
ncbi:MAG: LPS assembly lipoprotein LptE [Fibrobacterota bacterium]